MKKKLWITFGVFAILLAALLGGYTWVYYSAAKGLDFGDADIAELVVYQGDKEVARVSDPDKIEAFSQLFASETLRDDLMCASRAVNEEDRTAAHQDGCIEVVLTKNCTRFTEDASWSSHMNGQDGFDHMVLTEQGLFLYREEDGALSGCYPTFLNQEDLYQRAVTLLTDGT